MSERALTLNSLPKGRRFLGAVTKNWDAVAGACSALTIPTLSVRPCPGLVTRDLFGLPRHNVLVEPEHVAGVILALDRGQPVKVASKGILCQGSTVFVLPGEIKVKAALV